MKNWITWAALATFGSISAMSVALAVRSELRPKTTFDRAGLEAWFVAPPTDVPAPTEMRRAAWLLEQDFHSQYDWSPFYKSLDAAQQSRLRERWAMLLEDMFLRKARQFAAVPMVHRPEFVNAQLAALTSWYALDERGRVVKGPALFAQSESFLSAGRNRSKEDLRTLRNFRDELGKQAAARMLRPFLSPGAEEAGRRD